MLCHAVVSGQTYISVFCLGRERWYKTFVESCQFCGREVAFAHTVQQFDECGVLLTIYFLELYGDIVDLCQSLAAKEVWR